MAMIGDTEEILAMRLAPYGGKAHEMESSEVRCGMIYQRFLVNGVNSGISTRYNFFRAPYCAATEGLIYFTSSGLMVGLNRSAQQRPCEALWVGGRDGVGWWRVHELLYRIAHGSACYRHLCPCGHRAFVVS